MSLAQRLGRGLKAFTMRFARQSGAWNVYLPRTSFDYLGSVGDGTGSAAVMAPLLWIARTFPEAPVQLLRVLDDGQKQPVRKHPMVRLLRRPNAYFSAPALWMATVIPYYVLGNAYWLKVRGPLEEVRELWWIPNWTIKPKAPEDGSAFISHYEYRPGLAGAGTDSALIRIPPEDVVHFRFGVDPSDIRLGLSPLASVLREVFTDDEAANFTAALLRNMGVPGLLVAPEGERRPSPEDVASTKEYLRSMFTGDRRGEPMVMSAPTKIEQFGFSPEQMNLRELRRIPEERISAVLGVPAVVAGLGAGLDRSTFTNMGEAREMAYESNIIPAQRAFAEDLALQLLPDFEGEPEDFEVSFDLADVRVLQEDKAKRVSWVNTMISGGWATVGEGRRMLGLEVDDSHEVYLRPLNLAEVPADGQPRTGTTPEEMRFRLGAMEPVDSQVLAALVAAAQNGNGGG